MDEKLKTAYEAFYKQDYKCAKDLFLENGYLYEAGVSAFLSSDLVIARICFEKSKENDMASAFALSILNLVENKQFQIPSFFQIRAFFEVFINFFIESKHFDWAQKVIDNYQTFSRVNFEVPKFIARVLSANNFNKAVHSFCRTGKETCFYDAEVHFIDAELFYKEKDYTKALGCIEDCLKFAPDYFPVLKLRKKIQEEMSA